MVESAVESPNLRGPDGGVPVLGFPADETGAGTGPSGVDQGGAPVSHTLSAARPAEMAGPRPSRGYVLAIGFGTAVAMWGLGYLARLSPELIPSWGVLVGMLAVLLAGGAVAGRFTDDGWRAGAFTGLVTGGLNLLILGSILTPAEASSFGSSALWWVPASVLLTAAFGAAGAALGSQRPARRDDPVNWTSAFATVSAVATFFLLIVGGIVTGHEAGLAVVDWPNSFGNNMFLYPLSRMTGGIYFEHAHRLFGSLVGLTTVVLAVHLVKVDPRRWLRMLAIAAVVMVVVQGVLGGLRVTGTFTMSDDPAHVRPNLMLAVVHGVFGQVFFATVVALAVFTSTAWRRRTAGVVRDTAVTDRGAATALVVGIVAQLVLGAVLRHTQSGLLIHISMAVVVSGLAVFVGARAWGMKPSVGILETLGPRLITLVVIQLVLGVGAVIVTAMSRNAGAPVLADVIVTTLHQATGAGLLAIATVTMLWTFRLLSPRSA